MVTGAGRECEISPTDLVLVDMDQRDREDLDSRWEDQAVWEVPEWEVLEWVPEWVPEAWVVRENTHLEAHRNGMVTEDIPDTDRDKWSKMGDLARRQ